MRKNSKKLNYCQNDSAANRLFACQIVSRIERLPHFLVKYKLILYICTPKCDI